MHPIQIGPITLHSNLVQGPLAGYSCAPFRSITWEYGRPGFCTTEMISAKDLLHRNPKPKRYLGRDPQEGPLCYQLSGNDPDILGRASALVSMHGADLIDLNCGCPVNKIRSKGCGSKLLTSPEIIYSLVEAIKNNTDAAVSIKIRIAGEQQDHNSLAVLDAAQSAGADMLSVHGRHWTERYDKVCQHEEIAQLVNAATIPVFANGDVEDLTSLNRLINATGCAGVMIARAAVGQPWLFEQLRAEQRGRPFTAPTPAEIGQILLTHIQRLVTLEGEKTAILQSRKLAKYYARTLPNKRDFIIAMQQACSLKSVTDLTLQYFNARLS